MSTIQGSERWFVCSWENIITALAYLFCLALPWSCLAMFCKPFFTTLNVSVKMWFTPPHTDDFGKKAAEVAYLSHPKTGLDWCRRPLPSLICGRGRIPPLPPGGCLRVSASQPDSSDPPLGQKDKPLCQTSKRVEVLWPSQNKGSCMKWRAKLDEHQFLSLSRYILSCLVCVCGCCAGWNSIKKWRSPNANV